MADPWEFLQPKLSPRERELYSHIMQNPTEPRAGYNYDLYKDAAYGTTLDPYVSGQAAMGPQMTPAWDVVPTEPNATSALAYAGLFEYGLHNPITALGASDPSRMSISPTGQTFRGQPLLGWYLPSRDVGRAKVENGADIGALTHEFTHRGIEKLAKAYPEIRELLRDKKLAGNSDRSHTLMVAQDDLPNNQRYEPLTDRAPGYVAPTDEDRKLLADLIAKAQHEIYKQRPYGGPR